LEEKDKEVEEIETEKQELQEVVQQEETVAEEDTQPQQEQTQEDIVAKLEAQCADYLDKYQRCFAEFDNFRKRTIKEKASMYDDGLRSTVEKLLPVVYNLERAVAV